MARHFGFGEETTWGTAATVDHFAEAVSESVQVEQNFESVEVLTKISPVDLVHLNSVVRGDIELLADFGNLAVLAKHLMGNMDSATSGSVYSHTVPASTGVPAADRVGLGLTLEFLRDEFGATDLVYTYTGCKIVSWSHSFTVDQASRLTVGFLGEDEDTTITTKTTPTIPDPQLIHPSYVSLTFDGGGALPARNCTVDVDNPVDEAFILGSTALGREPVRSGVQRVTGTAEVLFENDTEYDKFSARSAVDIDIVATNGLSGASERRWEYHMNKCRLTQATPHNAGRERLVATYEWEAYYDAAATENLQIVIINGSLTP